ncbi:hypothetical protein ACFL18_02815 [Patescibacteria group bacterium]
MNVSSRLNQLEKELNVKDNFRPNAVLKQKKDGSIWGTNRQGEEVLFNDLKEDEKASYCVVLPDMDNR